MKKMTALLRKNNKGASMVVALIAIAFVGILASVVLSSAVTNYKLKVMNNKAKKTFYSAESALQEIMAGLSADCYSVLENAYLYTVSHLAADGTLVKNDAANNTVHDEYVKGIYEMILTEDNKGADGLEEYLSSFLTNPENAKVVSVGSISYKEGSSSEEGISLLSEEETVYGKYSGIVLNDVIVQYKESRTDYFSNVTVDLELTYPDAWFDFVNDKSSLDTYLDYCFIGMGGVYFDNGDSRIEGNIYAGKEGITVSRPGGLVVGEGNKVSLFDGILVTPGSILLNDNAGLTTNSTNIWCDNIIVGEYGSHAGASFTMSANDTAYVSDDLNIWGVGSDVVLGDKYYGYSYGGSAAKSSAIVINGEKGTLDASEIRKLVLAGHSYLDLGEDVNDYMTADSIGIKASQGIYLVPVKYISSSNVVNATNPYKGTVQDWKKAGITVDLTEFFAYDLLNQTAPYVVKQSEGKCYIYLNFKDKASQVKYVDYILGRESTYDPNGDLDELKAILRNSTDAFAASISLPSSGDNTIITSGTIYDSDDLSGRVGEVKEATDDLGMQTICIDKSNRFGVLNMLLYDIAQDYENFTNEDISCAGLDVSFVTVAGKTVNSYSNSIYENIIDTTSVTPALADRSELWHKEKTFNLSTGAVNATGIIYGGGVSGSDTIVVNGDADNDGAVDYNGGVILAYDKNVRVTSDFTGLIITNKSIIVDEGVTVKANNDLVDTMLKDSEFATLAQYFFTYQTTNDQTKMTPDQISKDDLISAVNWRKNYAQ